MTEGPLAPLSESEVRNLLQRGEGQFVEFKSLIERSDGDRRPLEKRRARDLAVEYAAAFANADGGTLLLGVDDDGTPEGHLYSEEAIRDLLGAPQRRMRPPLRCASQRMALDGHEVLIIQVPMAPEAVMVEGNGFPYRVGDRVIREPQEVINERKQAYRRVGYEPRLHLEATLDDLDLDLADRFLARTPYRGRPLDEILERYGLVVRRHGALAITNACLLLFGRPPMVRWHPRAGIRFFRVAGRERTHGSSRNVAQLPRVDLPLAAAIPEAHRLAREQIRRSERLYDLFFREMPEYPEFAWQEALVNAFAHREYLDQSREIEVWFYEDRMEVRNPGEPVPPVTVELLRQGTPIHASRNPLMVRVLADAGIMREEGEGIPRMFAEMRDSHLPAPTFDVDSAQFIVRLLNEPVYTGPSAELQRIVGALPLTQTQRRVLLAHPDAFSNQQYRALNSMGRDRAYQEIQEMVALGVISPAQGRGRGAWYAVTLPEKPKRVHDDRIALNANEVTQRGVTQRASAEEEKTGRRMGWPEKLPDRIARLQAHFAQKLSLTSQEYQQLVPVTAFTGKRELRRLVEEGWLTVEGRRRAARYSRGPRLSVSVPGSDH